MAESSSEKLLLHDIKTLLWGSTVKEDVFERWAQGFCFSQEEPTALVQTEGGPCAVIAPVQAFLLKQILQENILDWENITNEKRDELLVKAMTEIINQAVDATTQKYSIVHTCSSSCSGKQDNLANDTETEARTFQETSKTSDTANCETPSNFFHKQLRIFTVQSLEEVEKFIKEKLSMLKDSFGVLLLLYTVVCTKGIEQIRTELTDTVEPLIDSTFGYGSQSLINLMLTGRAVGHVWDYDQDVGGLKLRGIEKQNTVGFLTLLEHLRYCEVGSFLKSPANPVWVLGSETHLTVLFSPEKNLVGPETPAERARRIFKKYDPERRNFISSNLLQDVLSELGLVADVEYVDIIKKKLDSECFGIILLANFMEEFFPEEPRTCPDTFVLYHYNGLLRSNPDNKVQYHKGQAVLLECTVKCILESNTMLTILQTKWPNIEIQWDLQRTPSLN